MDPKGIALFEVKLLSRDKALHIPYNIHVHFLIIYMYICTCFTMIPLVTANIV